MPTKKRRTIVGPVHDVPFGEIIRLTFEQSGLTQAEFAARLGVKQPRIPEIFRTESMTEQLVDRCMVALDVRLEVKVTR